MDGSVLDGLDRVQRAYLRKKTGYMQVSGDVRTIAIGSSHGAFAFNPLLLGQSYNFCTASQDLQYSLRMLEWAVAQNPALQHVLLFYSTFSAGFNLCLAGDKRFAVGFRQIFGFPYYANHAALEAVERANPDVVEVPPDDGACRGYLVQQNPVFLPASDTAKVRAHAHLRFTVLQYPNVPQHAYVEAMAALATRRGIELRIVIPPCMNSYRAEMPTSERLFLPLKQWAGAEGVPVIDLYEDDDFTDEDFGDTDHLDPRGEGPSKLLEKTYGYGLSAASRLAD